MDLFSCVPFTRTRKKKTEDESNIDFQTAEMKAFSRAFLGQGYEEVKKSIKYW